MEDPEEFPPPCGTDDERCDGLECPVCHHTTLGYWVAPGTRDPACTCDGCGHRVRLYDFLRGRGLTEECLSDIAALANAGTVDIQ